MIDLQHLEPIVKDPNYAWLRILIVIAITLVGLTAYVLAKMAKENDKWEERHAPDMEESDFPTTKP